MNKSQTIISLLNDITEHCADMRETIEEVENEDRIGEDIKARLLFKTFYLKLAIQNIEYYL